jgi:hypothetical protein
MVAFIDEYRGEYGVEAVSSPTSGAEIRESVCIGPAMAEAIRSGLFRAMRLGTSSPITRVK